MGMNLSLHLLLGLLHGAVGTFGVDQLLAMIALTKMHLHNYT